MNSFPARVAKASRKRPAYIDVTAPKKARDDHAIAARNKGDIARAFLRVVRGLFDKDAELALRQRLATKNPQVEDLLDSFDWFNPADLTPSPRWASFGDALDRAYSRTITDSGNASLRELGLGKRLRFEVTKIDVPPNPFSATWIAQRSSSLVTGTSLQQQSMLRGLLIGSLRRGDRADTIADDISRVVGLTDRDAKAVIRRKTLILTQTGSREAANSGAERYSRQLLRTRGRTIARTETREAISRGQQDSWKVAQEQGAVSTGAKKRWVSMPESPRLSDICAELDGQEVKIDEDFQSTIVGSLNGPPAHPNCRSVMVLIEP